MTKIILALTALVILSACSDFGTSMSLDGPIMKNTEAQALPPYHVTQSFSAQQ